MIHAKTSWSMDQSSDEEEGEDAVPGSSEDNTRPVFQSADQDGNEAAFNSRHVPAGDDESLDQDRDLEGMTLMEETSSSTVSKDSGSGRKGNKTSPSRTILPSVSTSDPNNEDSIQLGAGSLKPINRRASVSSTSSVKPDEPGAKQASSGKKRKPGKSGDRDGEEEVKRTRIASACINCKQKKIKCDGEDPCSGCIKKKLECSYSHNIDKNAYSRRYVDSLEQRIKRMEQALQQSSLPQQAPPPSRHRSDPMRPSEPAPEMISFAAEASDLPSAEAPLDRAASIPTTPASTLEGPGSLVSSWGGNATGRLQLDENRSLRYLGPSASVTLFLDAHNSLGSQSASRTLELAMLPPDTNTEDLSWLHSSMGMSLSNVLPSAETVTFPPPEHSRLFTFQFFKYDLARMLVRIYFDQIHSVFPVLDQREFTLHYEQLYSAPRSSNADPTFLSILFAVFAVASRCCRDPRVCPEGKEAEKFGYKMSEPREKAFPDFSLAGIAFFARSQVLSLHRATHTRLEQVQCTALLSYYMASCNCTARAWILIGSSLRAAIDLGFHRDLSHLNLSFFEISMRRHVFWNIYILDRLLSISLGRPLGIEDDNIDALLPQLQPQPPFPLLAGFASIVSLHRLTGNISRTANRLEAARHRGDASEASRLRNQAYQHEVQLSEWFSQLPEHLKSGQHESGSPLATQSCIAFSVYQSAAMVLYRALLQDDILVSGGTSGSKSIFLAKCTRTCLMVIKSARRIASSLPASHYLMEFAQQLLVAGGFLALNAWKHSSSNAAQLLQEADEAVAGLRALEFNLPGSKNLRRALVRLLRSLRTKLGMRGKSGVNTPSATKSLTTSSISRPPDRQSAPSGGDLGQFSPAEVPVMQDTNGGGSHSPEVSKIPDQNPYFSAAPSSTLNADGTAGLADLDDSLLALSNSNTENWSGLDWLTGLLNDSTSGVNAQDPYQEGQPSTAPISSGTGTGTGTGGVGVGAGNENSDSFDFSAALWDDQIPIFLEEAGDNVSRSEGKKKAKEDGAATSPGESSRTT